RFLREIAGKILIAVVAANGLPLGERETQPDQNVDVRGVHPKRSAWRGWQADVTERGRNVRNAFLGRNRLKSGKGRSRITTADSRLIFGRDGVDLSNPRCRHGEAEDARAEKRGGRSTTKHEHVPNFG